jgi:hypothetical protein
MNASRFTPPQDSSNPQPEATLRLKHEHEPMQLEFHAANEERLEYLKTQVDMMIHPAAFQMIREKLEQGAPLDEALLSQTAELSRVSIEERRILQMAEDGPYFVRAVVLKKPSPSSAKFDDEEPRDTLDFALHLVKEPGTPVRADLTFANENQPPYNLNTLINRWKCVDELVARLGYNPIGWDIGENARNKAHYTTNDLFDFDGFTLVAPRAALDIFDQYEPLSNHRTPKKGEPSLPLDGEDPHNIYDGEDSFDEDGDVDLLDDPEGNWAGNESSAPKKSLDPQPCEPLTILRPGASQIAAIGRLSKWRVNEAVVEKALSLATTRELLDPDLMESKLCRNVRISQSRTFQMRGWMERTHKVTISPADEQGPSSISVEISPYMPESLISESTLKARISWEEFDHHTHVKNWSKIVQTARGTKL